jgi:HlyD family secretion protein
MIGNRSVAIGAVVVVALALLVYGFWPEATPVSVEEATRDSLRVTVEEEGQTQLREEYVVSAPTTGYLKRVPGEAGDSVRRDEVLARLATLPSKVLDASDYQAAEAQVQAARAAVQRAKEERAGAKASFQYAKEEHRRLQRLHKQGTASQQQLDQAEVEFRQARARHRAATEAVAQAKGELAAARSRLAREAPSPDALPSRVSIRAPAEGRILRVHRESAGVVQAGTPLFTVGTLDSLEVRVDLLSADAVRVTQGTPVEMVRWGGDRTLRGRVRLVEPRGRTEVSALGVEEQRVEVVANVELPAAVQGRLGTGYRVVARFILWDGADVLQVPQSALFRHDGGWAVFAVRDGRAQRQPVTVGRRSGLRVQITEGVTAGTRLVTHPGEALTDGMRVEVR